MPKLTPRAALAAAMCLLLLTPATARAQKRDAPKLEVGAHFTALELNPPDFDFFSTSTEPGVGGRFAYNATDYLGLEGEINFLPQRGVFGRTVQGQFGVKAGKRFGKIGVFAKARPGFVSHGQMLGLNGETITVFGPDGRQEVIPAVGPVRRTHLSVDVGGVLEFYPSRKFLVRVDAGDTMINYKGEELPTFYDLFPGLIPEGLTHNFQLSAGVAYRFHDPDGADESDPPAPEGDTPRFEAGVQYTALVINRPTEVRDDLSFPDRRLTEPAVGGRLTFNLNDHVALEGAVDFFTREQFTGPTFGGLGLQGQFGVKAGRRFERFGLFAKARPGFLSYGEVLRLEGTETINFNGQNITFGRFGTGRNTYFETDFGGVLEFYPKRRIVTRFDFGDTVVWYRDRVGPGFSLSRPIIRQPDETRHNFQFGAGIGFRF